MVGCVNQFDVFEWWMASKLQLITRIIGCVTLLKTTPGWLKFLVQIGGRSHLPSVIPFALIYVNMLKKMLAFAPKHAII